MAEPGQVSDAHIDALFPAEEETGDFSPPEEQESHGGGPVPEGTSLPGILPGDEASKTEVEAETETETEVEAEIEAEPISSSGRKTANERIQELTAQRNETRERLAAVEGRFQQMLDMMNAQQQQAQAQTAAEQVPEIPEMDDDPVGHLSARLERAERLNAELHQQFSGNQQQQQQAAYAQRVAQGVKQSEDSFAQQHEDYYPAVEALKKARFETWKNVGYSDEDAARAVNQEAYTLAAQTMQNGQDPATVFYNMAKPYAPVAQTLEESNSVGSQPAQRPGSLGQRGKSPAKRSAKLTIENVMNLTDAQMAKLSDEQWFQLHKDAGLV